MRRAPLPNRECLGTIIRMEGVAELVTEMYLSTLDRQPDQAGLAHHIVAIERDPSFFNIAGMLHNMRDSQEAALRPRLISGARRERSYKYVVPFGTRCYPALVLDAMGRRDAVYPFDWLSSSPSMILHCLRDDFATFLDPSYYRAWPTTSSIQHMYYRDTLDVDSVFAHVDPRTTRDYTYMRRTVRRFRNVCRGDGASLFLMISHRGESERFHDLAQAIDTVAPNADLLMVVLQEPETVSHMGFSTAEVSGRHKHVLFRPSSPLANDGQRFENPIDDLMIRALLLSHDIAA